MPTLLQINVTGNSGSHGIIADEIGLIAIKRGWRSLVAYGRWFNPSQNELIQIGSVFSVMEHGLESRFLDNHGLASRIATHTFIHQIQEIKPDIVHLHNIHGYYLNYKLLFEYLNNTNIPVVWTLHDCWTFTGHCAHFVTVGCEKWKTECFNCPLKGDYPKSLMDFSRRNYALKKALFTGNKNLHIVPVSAWLAELTKESFFKDKDIQIIHNGIDLSVFYPHPVVDRNRFRILGVSGVWNKNKGLYDFFKLRDLLDKDKYEIVMIGLTKKQLKDLPEGITGIERTNSVFELSENYSSADVFVNLTYADTLPTVNMEALACGTPVITYRTGGSPEIIDDQTGWVVKQGDVKMVSSIIESICDAQSKDESKVRRIACRKRAEEYFDKDKCFEKYVSLYDKLIINK